MLVLNIQRTTTRLKPRNQSDGTWQNRPGQNREKTLSWHFTIVQFFASYRPFLPWLNESPAHTLHCWGSSCWQGISYPKETRSRCMRSTFGPGWGDTIACLKRRSFPILTDGVQESLEGSFHVVPYATLFHSVMKRLWYISPARSLLQSYSAYEIEGNLSLLPRSYVRCDRVMMRSNPSTWGGRAWKLWISMSLRCCSRRQRDSLTRWPCETSAHSALS